ncbi:unnamed protein product [Clonostachys chloroleuca]|uniref:Uncharacterized protein n=1 Tax=Clonostachys chloroleuca TaxID=1926264 RepID=A0AA35Q0Y7_9HYPO|nr:unnamed protein product [Clonostachys chloroleuca]
MTRGIPNKEASGIQGLGKGHDMVQADKTMRGSVSKDAADACRTSYAAARICAYSGVEPVVRGHRRTGAGARRGGILVAVASGVEGRVVIDPINRSDLARRELRQLLRAHNDSPRLDEPGDGNCSDVAWRVQMVPCPVTVGPFDARQREYVFDGDADSSKWPLH